MRKHMKILAILALAVLIWNFSRLLEHKRILSGSLIRLHVVADSDEGEEQAMKLRVRDAVLEELEKYGPWDNVEDARRFLSENLGLLEDAANRVLESDESAHKATVSLCREAFPVRHYDTFSLPSGVYESLRVTIGSGEGKNWWCVVFPKLCIPATGEGFTAAAVSAGFPEELAETVAGQQDYRISFFLLDCLGKLENFFHFR